MEEVGILVQEAENVLDRCRETIDDYVAFAQSCSTDEKIEQGNIWADEAIATIITELGDRDMSIVGIAALLERLHATGLNLLEHNFKMMVKEKFSEQMA
jgi:hypothetical protein